MGRLTFWRFYSYHKYLVQQAHSHAACCWSVYSNTSCRAPEQYFIISYNMLSSPTASTLVLRRNSTHLLQLPLLLQHSSECMLSLRLLLPLRMLLCCPNRSRVTSILLMLQPAGAWPQCLHGAAAAAKGVRTATVDEFMGAGAHLHPPNLICNHNIQHRFYMLMQHRDVPIAHELLPASSRGSSQLHV